MDVEIIQLPDGRLILLPAEFGSAAHDRYRETGPQFRNGSRELWDAVVKHSGKVDFFTARQFLESHDGRLFAKNGQVADIRTRQPLKALGFETVINLYQAVTERPMKDNSLYLDLLNRSIELTQEEMDSWTTPVKAFWAPANAAFIERKWQEAKTDGVIAASEKSFAETMADGFENPQLISGGGYLRRKALLQFISDAYSEFNHEDKVIIELIQGPPGLGGFHTVDEETGRNVIGINVANFAFQSNFQSIMNVLNHERYHASDKMLADKYLDGKIREGDPVYKRARIAAAAMSRNGYISGDTQAGPLAYREQVIELGAHHAGKVAEYHSHVTYAKEPEAVLSLRGDKALHDIDQEYEVMAMRRTRIQYPEGLSPFAGRGRRAALEVAPSPMP